MTHEPLLTVREASEYLDVHMQTVRRWVHEGKLACVHVGPYDRMRIPQKAVQELRRETTAA